MAIAMDVAATVVPAPSEQPVAVAEVVLAPEHKVIAEPEVVEISAAQLAEFDAALERRMKSVLVRVAITVAHITMLCVHQFDTNALVAAYLVLDLAIPVPTKRISKLAHKATFVAVQLYGVIQVARADWDLDAPYTRALLVYCVCCITFRVRIELQDALFAVGYVVLALVLMPCICCDRAGERRKFQRALRRLQPALVRSLTDIHDVCAVCIESIEVGAEILTLPCNHKFHANCVAPWLRDNGTCPTCRGAITEQ